MMIAGREQLEAPRSAALEHRELGWRSARDETRRRTGAEMAQRTRRVMGLHECGEH
jgi:hypothetical protein